MSSSSANKARASTGAALNYANVKLDPSCTECTDIPDVRAIILHPNLGTPLILHSSEKILNFFIAGEEATRSLFGVNPSANNYPEPAPLGYLYVDKHLRFYSINKKNIKENTKDGRLWNDGKICAKAASHVKVWCVGMLEMGVIKDVTGKIIANIRPKTIDDFNSIRPAHTDPNDSMTHNSRLKWLYQVQIELEGLPKKLSEDEIVSIAWMVPMPERYKKEPTLMGIEDWEYQDKLIYDFLEAQKYDSSKGHISDLYEFNVESASSSKFPKIKKDASHRLKAWHPIMMKTKHSLRIGHLSDVHVNSRQFSLAASEAQVLEGISRRLGENVDNCFIALKELFEKMKQAGADALVLTGDLLDFNRNLDPRDIADSSPQNQWPAFDLSEKITNSKLYPRGIDDMLVFSLLRYSYEKLNLPVYITTGNHEAYDVPYGISPRANPYLLNVARNQITSDTKVVIPSRLRASGLALKAAEEKIKNFSDTVKSIPYVGPDWSRVSKAKDELLQKAIKKLGVSTNPNDFQLLDKKMNEGIPADHNLTIYEACLIYGPSFPQVIKPFNFMPENFDWFFNLFTPLSDFRIDYESQVLVGLDWGSSEVMVNFDISGGELYRTTWDSAGLMGALTGLPRANESISDRQRKIVEEARSSHKRFMLFTHFTLINYDYPVALDTETPYFAPSDNVFNQFTKGTFSKGRDWLYPRLNNGIHYVMSGHSHRCGVYRINFSTSGAISAKGYQPGEYSKADAYASRMHKDFFRTPSVSRIAVSSSGGPIGIQNLKGELYGWNLMPPSGTLVDIATDEATELQRVPATKYHGARPRFCVALDYVQVHCNKQVVAWIPTENAGHYWLVIGNVLDAKPFIKEIKFYVWDFKIRKFKQFASEISSVPGHPFLYDLRIPDHVGLFAKSLVQSEADVGKIHAFAQVEFNQALSASVLYGHYNFDDPWIFRIDVIKSDDQLPFITPASGWRAEIPDWEWVSTTNPARYPVPTTRIV